MNNLYLFFNVFLTLFIFSCSTQIIQNQVNNPKDILDFDLDGYKFNKKLSTELNPVFTR